MLTCVRYWDWFAAIDLKECVISCLDASKTDVPVVRLRGIGSWTGPCLHWHISCLKLLAVFEL